MTARYEAMMAPPGLKRRLERLTQRVDKVIESDRRFFARQPWRQHRVRLASRPEIEVQAMLSRWPATLPGGSAYYVAVRQVQPGYRIRIMFASAAGNDVDVPEEEARWCYEHFGRGAPIVEDDEHGRRA